MRPLGFGAPAPAASPTARAQPTATPGLAPAARAREVGFPMRTVDLPRAPVGGTSAARALMAHQRARAGQSLEHALTARTIAVIDEPDELLTFPSRLRFEPVLGLGDALLELLDVMVNIQGPAPTVQVAGLPTRLSFQSPERLRQLHAAVAESTLAGERVTAHVVGGAHSAVFITEAGTVLKLRTRDFGELRPRGDFDAPVLRAERLERDGRAVWVYEQPQADLRVRARHVEAVRRRIVAAGYEPVDFGPSQIGLIGGRPYLLDRDSARPSGQPSGQPSAASTSGNTAASRATSASDT